MHSLIPSLINFAILIGLLVFYLHAPLRAFVRGRHESLRDELKRVADQLRQAQERYDEFSAKLKAMQAEIGALREQARQDGQAIKLRLIQDGQRVAQTIVEDARGAADAVLDDLKIELRRELGGMVLQSAERIIRERLKPEDQVRMRREFAREVETAQ